MLQRQQLSMSRNCKAVSWSRAATLRQVPCKHIRSWQKWVLGCLQNVAQLDGGFSSIRRYDLLRYYLSERLCDYC